MSKGASHVHICALPNFEVAYTPKRNIQWGRSLRFQEQRYRHETTLDKKELAKAHLARNIEP